MALPAQIPLPVIRPVIKNAIKYPTAAPENPPSMLDVAAGIYLSQEIYAARSESPPQPRSRSSLMMPSLERNEATDQEVVDSARYEAALLASNQGLCLSFSLALLS